MLYKPKAIVATLHEQAGGMINAQSASELPLNRQQVYNSCQRSASTQGGSNKVDSLFSNVKLITYLVEGDSYGLLI